MSRASARSARGTKQTGTEEAAAGVVRDLPCRFRSQPGFTHPARPGQRHQPRVRCLQRFDGLGAVLLTSEEPGELEGQAEEARGGRGALHVRCGLRVRERPRRRPCGQFLLLRADLFKHGGQPLPLFGDPVIVGAWQQVPPVQRGGAGQRLAPGRRGGGAGGSRPGRLEVGDIAAEGGGVEADETAVGDQDAAGGRGEALAVGGGRRWRRAGSGGPKTGPLRARAGHTVLPANGRAGGRAPAAPAGRPRARWRSG